MGTMQHHAIVVITYDKPNKLHELAKSIFPWVSPFVQTPVNGYYSFFIPPDGSKEYWPESALGDEQRKKFFDAAKDGKKYGWADIVEVQWGELGSGTKQIEQEC